MKVNGKLLKQEQGKLFSNHRKLEFASIASMIVLWEGFAYLLKLFTPHAETILPPIENLFGKSLPNFAIFYGMGGIGTGKYGAEPSYSLAFLVIGYHTLRTFFRIIGGFLIGGVTGIGLGLLVKANKEVRAFISLPLQFIRIIPLMALITLFIVWFGDSELGFILYIAFGVFVTLFINTISAVDNVPPVYQKFALTLGATQGQLFRTVIVPAFVPELMGGVKMIVGQAWALSLAAEFISSQNGLGRIIVLARQRFDTGMILIVIGLYIVYTLLFLKVLYSIGDYITRWMPRMEK